MMKLNLTEQQNKLVVKIDKKLSNAIEATDRKKLGDAYMKLYFGLSWVNWTKQQSLGRAWQTALDQCDSFLKTKNKSNPTVKYLDTIAKAHKAQWSRVIMTNKNSQNTLNKTSEEIQQMQQYGHKQIREAMDVMNLISARYNGYTEQLDKTPEKSQVKPQPAKNMENKSKKPIAPEQVEKTAPKSAAQRLDAQKPAGNQSEKVIKRPVMANAKPIVQKPVEQNAKPIVEKTQRTKNAQELVQQRIKMFIMSQYNQKSA